MPLTLNDVAELIARDLLKKYVLAVTLQQVRDALQGMSAGEQTALLSALRERETERIGQVISRVVVEYLKGLALVEAQGMTANSVLNLTEINRWLGDG